MIEKLRREADGVLLLSAGDDLTGYSVQPQLRAARGKLILDAYRKMGVDAMATGEQERASGADLGGLPTDSIVERAGIKFGVFAADLETADAPSLQARSAKLRQAGATIVVAALHGEPSKVRGTLKSGATGVDLAVLGHSGFGLQWGIERMGDTWVAEAPWQGQKLAQLDIHILDGKLDFQDLGKMSVLESRLEESKKMLEDLGRRQGQMPTESYTQRRRGVTESVLAMYRELRELKMEPGRSWLELRQTPIEPSLPEEPGVASLVRAHKEEMPKLLANRPPIVPQPLPPLVPPIILR